ncbi:MAG: hypothetical protein ACI4QS_08350 [Comamonas sp.]
MKPIEQQGALLRGCDCGMRSVYVRWSAGLLLGCLSGCGDFVERLGGYPKEDTVINLETATPNQIADALIQLASISTLGDDWEFVDPDDPCTVQILSQSDENNYTLDLRGARFRLQRDASSQRYYATMRHGDREILDTHQRPLRLFEAETYHAVFFAEGYLQALARQCARAQPVSVHAEAGAAS